MTPVTLQRMARELNLSRTTLIEVCTAKLGNRRDAARVCAFLMEWQTVRSEYGRDITVAEYMAATGYGRATVFRRIATFRQVFDAEVGTSPNDVVQLIQQAQAAQRSAKPTRNLATA
jgi:AraC-like DNA-binding protein